MARHPSDPPASNGPPPAMQDAIEVAPALAGDRPQPEAMGGHPQALAAQALAAQILVSHPGTLLKRAANTQTQQLPDDLRSANLAGADLSGADLSGRDMRGVNLAGAQLKGARLCNANLERADLRGADLSEAELLSANLEHADLSGATANRAGLGKAKLHHANLASLHAVGASLGAADLSRANLSGANLSEARLGGADLSHADLSGCRLFHADLTGATVAHAHFRRCDLRGSALSGLRRFESAEFLHVDIRDVNFSGAYRLRRHIMDMEYLSEFRSQGPFASALYWLWWLSSDCGRSLLRFGLWVVAFVVAFGVAYARCNIDYGDHPTPLSPYYFSLVTLSTLGYGDVTPADAVAQALVMVQVSLGYLMLAGLTAIFTNKMARRAE